MHHEAASTTQEQAAQTAGEHAVLVTSIAQAPASIIGALKEATQLHEQLLAHRLFQAPSLLFSELAEPLAQQLVSVLRDAGVECEVVPKGHRFVPGGADHEIALYVRDTAKMQAIIEGVMTLLGVGAREAKEIICATPAVLMGRVSAATVAAVRQRFEGLGVDVEVTKPDEARYDVFLVEDSGQARAAALELLARLGLEAYAAASGGSGPMLAEQLPRDAAERLHALGSRGASPLAIFSRDFQRFDLRLEAAPSSAGLRQFLVEVVGMPERIVPKVLARLPIVIGSGLPYAAMREQQLALEQLGARATAQLVCFQRFGLVLGAVHDAQLATTLLRDLGGLPPAEIERALRGGGQAVGALSGTLARWLQRELECRGIKCRRVLI